VKRQRREVATPGSFISDGVLDAYVRHLRATGGAQRRRDALLLPTDLSQLLWYASPGDSGREIGSAGLGDPFADYGCIYALLNLDPPSVARHTGGSHWFLVVLRRDGRRVCVCDSHAHRLPTTDNTRSMFHRFFGGGPVVVVHVATPPQRENECALRALQTLEILYRLGHARWDPAAIRVESYARGCGAGELRRRMTTFLQHAAPDVGWLLTRPDPLSLSPGPSP
jgi:hypothetical protein